VLTPPVIAIVDDDDEMRDALSDLLEVGGLTARCFASAEAFLAAHAPGAFAALITDIRMTGLSGLELLALLRRAEPELPVIVVTSTADVLTRPQALDAGATAVLPKPFNPADLLDQLAHVLGQDPGS